MAERQFQTIQRMQLVKRRESEFEDYNAHRLACARYSCRLCYGISYAMNKLKWPVYTYVDENLISKLKSRSFELFLTGSWTSDKFERVEVKNRERNVPFIRCRFESKVLSCCRVYVFTKLTECSVFFIEEDRRALEVLWISSSESGSTELAFDSWALFWLFDHNPKPRAAFFFSLVVQC